MKQGGTVLFDTRDAVSRRRPAQWRRRQTPGMQTLRDILSSLDVPELEPVPREHVLTKTFYLLRDFPGRFNTGQTWVEALPREDDDEDARSAPARGGDGVSSIIITSNDLAGAWAMRPDGQPMLPLAPRRAAPARIRVPRRRQHRDVHADRQLQGRPGARAGADRAAGTIGSCNYGIAFTPLVPALVLWVALGRDRRHRGSLLVLARARRRGARRRAGAVPAGARQSVLHPRGPRAAVLGRRRRGRQEPEPEVRQPQPARPSRRAKRWSTA